MTNSIVTRALFFGMIIGFIFGVLFSVCYDEVISNTKAHFGLRYKLYQKYFERNIASKLWKHDTSYANDENTKAAKSLRYASEDITQDSNTESVLNDMHRVYGRKGDEKVKELATNLRILCWVMTQPNNLATKAKAVNETWGKRCNILLFMSSKNDTNFKNVISLDVPEDRKYLTLKVKAAFKYVYENHYNNADWLIKADDDTFVILGNLRYFLSQYNSSDSHFFGHFFSHLGGFNNGGSGYVFSKKTLKVLNGLMNDTTKCKFKTGLEDVEVGQCLRKVDIYPVDTRDGQGRKTFHLFDTKYHIDPKGKVKELSGNDKWEVKVGRECCSNYSLIII